MPVDFVDILQPCVSFNHKNTFQWYRERVYKLEGNDGYDPSDKKAVLEKAEEWGERILIGIIYRKELPTYEEGLPALRKGLLVSQEINPAQFEKLFDEFI